MQSRQKMVLSDDGELQDVTTEEAVYCIHCGTANRADGHFCRTCGQGLDDQVVSPYIPPERKNKLAELANHPAKLAARRSPPPMTAGMVIVELFTLLVMSMLVMGTLWAHQVGITIAVLIAWFLVETARHGGLN